MRFKSLIAIVAIALAATSAAPVHAGGPGDFACLVDNANAGATALRGTLAVHVQEAAFPTTTPVDFTLRLEKGGTAAFFRTSYLTSIYARSNEAVLCELLVDNSTVTAITDFRAAILASFGLKRTTRLVLTRKSLSQAETQGQAGQWFCTGYYTTPTIIDPASSPCGADARGGSMADVLIYAQ